MLRYDWSVTFRDQVTAGTYYGTFQGAFDQIALAVRAAGWGFTEPPVDRSEVTVSIRMRRP